MLQRKKCECCEIRDPMEYQDSRQCPTCCDRKGKTMGRIILSAYRSVLRLPQMITRGACYQIKGTSDIFYCYLAGCSAIVRCIPLLSWVSFLVIKNQFKAGIIAKSNSNTFGAIPDWTSLALLQTCLFVCTNKKISVQRMSWV